MHLNLGLDLEMNFEETKLLPGVKVTSVLALCKYGSSVWYSLCRQGTLWTLSPPSCCPHPVPGTEVDAKRMLSPLRLLETYHSLHMPESPKFLCSKVCEVWWY